jgi:Na+-driven multidrug efflux pump
MKDNTAIFKINSLITKYPVKRSGRPFHLVGQLIEPRQQIPEERKKFSNADLKTLIVPIIIEQFLALLVGIADTMMISYAGEAAVSGVSLVNQLNNVFIMVFTALASGGAVVASQYIGSKDRKNGVLAASQLVMITGLISILMTVVVLLFGRQMFDLLFGNVETDVLVAGLTYLRISAYSFQFITDVPVCSEAWEKQRN